jgi:2-amino-4-hydroxy-6-hydroxymethyldihydropteridine diphosphokinase
VNVVVGVGASGPLAEDGVRRAYLALGEHPQWKRVAVSDLYANPAIGGRTNARFVNGACVVDTALGLQALVLALHAIEATFGRVRVGAATKDGARALDLDVLLAIEQRAPTSWPQVPHPRVSSRPFAIVPAIEALERAGLAVPIALRAAVTPAPTLVLVR